MFWYFSSKKKLFVCSNTQKEKAEQEAAQSSALVIQVNPAQFSMQQSKNGMFGAVSMPNVDWEPFTPTPSIGCSPLSTTSSSTFTPDLDSMKLECGRGRSHKQITPVDYSDCPNDSLKEEQDKWIKRKNMEKW